MSVFTAFKSKPFKFLRLKTSVNGKTIDEIYDTTGIIKLRDMQSGSEVKTKTSETTIHIKPDEPFVGDLKGFLVGHGVRVGQGSKDPVDYEILAQTYGYNYETNELEHIRVVLQKVEIATWETSQLPIK
jgi:hypothetical protein